jgi:hypothetical protein
MSHRRIIWSITSSQLSAKRRPIHHFISVSERTTHPTHGIPHTRAHNIPSLSQRGTTHPPHGLPHTRAHNVPSPSQRGTTHLSHGNTQHMGFLTPHRGTQCSFSILERNNTPNSWALSQADSLSLCPGGCLT